MRKSEGKEIGYVLIPLYLEQKAGESLEEAIARANFEEVWDILQSLQEQDEVLAELIRDMAVAKGSGKGFDDSRFTDRIAFTGPVLALESIRQAVTTKVLVRLESSWDVNFGRLVKYKEEHGHCRVPFDDDSKLGKWVVTQRFYHARGILLAERFSRLSSIGIEWDLNASDWEHNFSKLQQFKNKNGHCRVPRNYKADLSLGNWTKTLRSHFSLKKLSLERISRLESLGFEWDPTSADWDRNFILLEEFKSVHGHTRIPQSYKIKAIALGAWANSVRVSYRKGELTSDRIARLNSLGFSWNLREYDWDLFYDKLLEFKKTHGHCRVPSKHKSDSKLATWVNSQRTFYSRGKLPENRINKLDSIGFDWSPQDTDWDYLYSKLIQFKANNNHCRVPRSYMADPELASWVMWQRINYSKGKLSLERISRLEGIGFEWDPISADWERFFENLKKFVATYGHCRVPYEYVDDLSLGTWVKRQRGLYSQNQLSLERISRLESLGFEWETRDRSWNLFFERLQNFKIAHGHCLVPHGYTSDPQLATWVKWQRYRRSIGKLSQNRIARLESLGFEWKLR
jgi:hypothetical protein